MNIIISLPLVWSIRNFILSGITKILSEKYEIYYAVTHDNRSLLLQYNIPEDHIISIKQGKKISPLFNLLKRAYLKRYNELGYMSDIMKEAGITRFNYSFKNQISNFITNVLAKIIQNKKLFSIIENLWFLLAGYFTDKEFSKQVVALQPAYILSTTFVVGIEWPLILVARKYNIPAYTHILSFDNLTSRGYLPVSKFDKYMVWNNKMKEELIHYYNVKPKKIEVTGTPQFDFHNHPDFIMPRTEALSLLGLNDNDKYLLYCANHIHHTPKEPELLNSLLIELNKDSDLVNYKIIVRLHPLDSYDRWQELSKRFGEVVVVTEPWSHPDPNNSAIGVVSHNDMKIFVNQLKHSDVVLNIASTIAIDAAMTGTPVVCIGFHPSDNKESECYRKYHFSTHYKTIMDFGAAPLSLDMDTLKEQIKKYIQNPEMDKARRELLASYYMPNYKTGASQKIIDCLLS